MQSVESGYEQARLEVMQSSGGIISAKLPTAEPVRTVLSGPAGGVIGAYKLATLAGFDRIIGFDMGGTSRDVCLVDASAGRVHSAMSLWCSGFRWVFRCLTFIPLCGGGSIAGFDAGGMLRVGPESAGSIPGPICLAEGNNRLYRCEPCAGAAGYPALSRRLGEIGLRAHDVLDGEGEGFDRDGGGFCCWHTAGNRDFHGEGDSRYFGGTRYDHAISHGGVRRRRTSACLLSGARLASAAGSVPAMPAIR